jgi:hypothetical protein
LPESFLIESFFGGDAVFGRDAIGLRLIADNFFESGSFGDADFGRKESFFGGVIEKSLAYASLNLFSAEAFKKSLLPDAELSDDRAPLLKSNCFRVFIALYFLSILILANKKKVILKF